MALTSIDSHRVQELAGLPIPAGTKGAPLRPSGLTLGDAASLRWRVLSGDVAMPVLVLKETALANNLAAMAAFARSGGALLCPHGKTTMAPQLFARQIEAGAWGLTAATPAHLAVYRHYGVQRILYANQLVEPKARGRGAHAASVRRPAAPGRCRAVWDRVIFSDNTCPQPLPSEVALGRVAPT